MSPNSQNRENAEPREQPTNFHPSPTGTPEERDAWADQVVEHGADYMRKLPKDHITPY